MMRMTLLALLLIVIGASAVPPAAAQIYRWTDEQGIAHFTEGLANIPERYRAQAVVVSPARPAPPVLAPATPSWQTLIRFAPGQQIIVPALVNGSISCRLMLDTGAAATLISPRVLASAGISLTHGTQSVRARGLAKDAELEVQRVFVNSLAVGEARVERLLVVAYEMDMPSMDGLLGQDFLGLFNVTIDAGSGIVRLGPK